MDCAEEVTALKRELAPLVGGEDHLGFDLLRAKLVVTDAEDLSGEAIVEAVRRTGLRAEPWHDDVPAPETVWARHGRTIVAALSGLFLLAGVASHMAIAGSPAAPFMGEGAATRHAVPLLARLLYLLGVLAGFWLVLPRAWSSARHLRPDMNLLMTIAVVGAIAIDEWFEAGAVAFLFAVSLALEAWSVGRARRAVEALMDLAPTVAHLVVREGGETADIDASEVAVGSRLLVKPGERIPLDGAVVSGESDVNQAPITGESVPVPKAVGAQVFAGTINGDGTLFIQSTKDARDTTLARIIRMVGEARSRRAPSEQWVDRFARIYTPAVMALALGLLALPPLVLGAPFSEWLYRALVLLVIACPCALVISTPVSIVAGLTAAARQGVLVKGGRYLEAPAHLRAVAFDKTGTLTEGRPRVVELVPLDDHSAEDLLARAAALEAHSDHPLARAIVDAAAERGIQVAPAAQFQIAQGRGASGRIGGEAFWLGSHRYLEERGQETPALHERLDAMSGEGRSVVVVGNDRHTCGLIGLADRVRDEAATTLEDLRKHGIEHLVMLTGDNQATARAIGEGLGLGEIQAELLPEDKVRAVEALVDRYGSVAMVGDGVNDAPAMARASLGIAMAAAGSDAAIETADVALMSDDLSRVAWLVAHSRRTLRTIRQNIAAALLVKGLFVVLTFVGAASLWSAIAADMGASLLVIFNGLRLMRRPAWDAPGEGTA
jgi:Cd2+/Zn2+-exporting ATPase